MAPPPLTRRTPAAPPGLNPGFSWPEFDRWQAAFAALDAFPPRWEELEHAPPAHTPAADAYQLRKLSLFDEWLDLLARRPAVLAHYARQGVRVQVARQDEREPCPVCDPFNAREVGGKLDAMPPFHPGCRCVLVAKRTGRVGQRRRSPERPRSRIR
jgi:hypothetical protein